MTPQPPADPPDFSDKYNTPIPPEKQVPYQNWRAALPKQLQSQRDYDLQGAFLNGTSKSANDHLTDTFKKPNHPTFSNESQYHGLDGYVGGQWTDDGYSPSATNLKFRSRPELQTYFNQVEPETKLLGDPDVPNPTGQTGQYRISDFAPYRVKPPVATPSSVAPALPQPIAPRRFFKP